MFETLILKVRMGSEMDAFFENSFKKMTQEPVMVAYGPYRFMFRRGFLKKVGVDTDTKIVTWEVHYGEASE